MLNVNILPELVIAQLLSCLGFGWVMFRMSEIYKLIKPNSIEHMRR